MCLLGDTLPSSYDPPDAQNVSRFAFYASDRVGTQVGPKQMDSSRAVDWISADEISTANGTPHNHVQSVMSATRHRVAMRRYVAPDGIPEKVHIERNQQWVDR